MIIFIDDSTSGGGGGGSHRYWRITNCVVPSSDYLEISELRIYTGGVLADGTATLSSSHAPNFGSLSNLADGALNNRTFWNPGVVTIANGWWFKWAFASPVVINGLRQGGFDTSSRYLSAFDFQWSDDNSSWTTQSSKSGLTYPGNNTYSALYDVSS